MRISLISFTLHGSRLCKKLSIALNVQGYEVRAYAMEAYAKELALESAKGSLQDWTSVQFEAMDGIIFIGAAGIAVRAIAPFVKDKRLDPAVLVIDEKGEYIIPILSGHIGGANELAKMIGECIGGTPVITTATDIHHTFAVDVFAKRNNLYITRMDYAKEISAAVLQGQSIGFGSDYTAVGPMPSILSWKQDCKYGICISLKEEKRSFPKTLNLIPCIITLGIGCRKGKSMEEIEKVVLEVLKFNDISIHGVCNVATIDLKKEEKGLLEFCKKYNVEMEIYTAAMLDTALGEYIESEYVKSITGIGNVCERAAYLGSQKGTIIQKKYAKDGVTVSIGRKDWSVRFE